MMRASHRRQGLSVEKIATVKSCLEASFAEVREVRSSELQRFVLHDGGHSSELIFSQLFLDRIRPEQLSWFQEHLMFKIIPIVKANPGKRIFVSDSGTAVLERESSDPHD
jgi:hypothetical protein